MLDFLRETLVAEGTIEPTDLNYFYQSDSAAEASEYVRDIALRKFGLRYVSRPEGPRLQKRRWWLLRVAAALPTRHHQPAHPPQPAPNPPMHVSLRVPRSEAKQSLTPRHLNKETRNGWRCKHMLRAN